ncbi:hypothetical protein J437_LFUL007442 [Ladona fulva]|uniref:Nucleotide exchange factor SIL1 n=1 Tax=Ladona fulva TaxID=123851 RepID=A0A8K0KC50_LADFU|nr:hypothetical protein J437_LFUL007442 [Ladona fulva]
MHKIIVIVFLLVHFKSDVYGESHVRDGHNIFEEDEESNTPFIPTKEWQKVKRGQAIPAGIHSRLNLKTGEVEAKLLDEDDGKRTAVTKISEKDSSTFKENPGEKDLNVLTKEHLKNVLSKFSDEIEIEDEDTEVVKQKFRSYEELKKEFDELKMSIKTDSEFTEELLARLKGASDPEEIVAILTDLEYLLHQTDNAVNFAKDGGLSSVVLPAINSSNMQVAIAALRLLGSASQSNPKVQIAALEAGAVEKVLHLLKNPELSSTALFALSCIIRRFPLAQKTFVQHGGLSVLASLFDESYRKGVIVAEDLSVKMRAKVKAVSLLYDLMLEQEQADEEALKQYKLIGLKEQIYSNEWCDLFPSLLTALDDHDAAEKGAEAMLAVWDTCQTQFLNAASVVLEAEKHYLDLSRKETEEDSEEVTDGYFTSLAQLLSKLTTRMKISKDEL